MPDYDAFFAVCDHIGHDKRGNTIYVRDEDGYEVVAEIEDAVAIDTDRLDEESFTTRSRVVDDNTGKIADAFRGWLAGEES